ncbi:polyadenylate-binding protein 1-like isoform X2 [Diorhabda carinulata]|uniref:polyadenylate-binding protein 1-like isoform X2 n=1 Tax=Diorhabda carinulata TaxID=1163345 RepID=UPI0025A24730|nr:polyadenylate-binding protein 1-like isoform X2 [Diorhabda carinulata]
MICQALPTIGENEICETFSRSPAVYVENLEKKFGSQNLYALFSDYGIITECAIYTNKRDDCPGYGIVHFKEVDDAKRCVEALNGKFVRNQRIFVKLFIPEENHKTGNANERFFTKLHIDNLPISTDEEKLYEMFQLFGEVVRCKIVRDNYGVSRGFGCVEYQYPEVALAAIEGMNGMLMENNQRLYVTRFKSFVEREEEKLERIHKHKRTICIRNLDVDITKIEMESAFAQFGEIVESRIKFYRYSRVAFGLVTYITPDNALKAVSMMNGKIIKSNKLIVTSSKLMEDGCEFTEDEPLVGTSCGVNSDNHNSSMMQNRNPRLSDDCSRRGTSRRVSQSSRTRQTIWPSLTAKYEKTQK